MKAASKLAVVVAVLISMSACKTAKKTEGEGESTPNAPAIEETALGDSDSGRALGLVTIHFPYDAFTLSNEAKAQLKTNAQILKDKASVKVQVEGHCDQRGGIQYNIALGEKRANAVRKYLESLGIKAERVSTISYGKERLVDQAETEDAYAKNRRANFVITSR